jgi:ribosomal protein S27AE
VIGKGWVTNASKTNKVSGDTRDAAFDQAMQLMQDSTTDAPKLNATREVALEILDALAMFCPKCNGVGFSGRHDDANQWRWEPCSRCSPLRMATAKLMGLFDK